MTRGGRKKDRDGPERRCIATGESGPTDRLVRFVLSPDGEALPDVAGKLPGRGAWLTADRALVERATRKNLFARAFRQQVRAAPDLADRLERLLAERLIQAISLARKAGQAVTGAEKVRARIAGGQAGVLLQAHDGAADGLAKIARLAAHHPAPDGGDIARIRVLSAQELGLAFGREFAIHATLDAGGFASRVRQEAARLSGLRPHVPAERVSEETMATGAPAAHRSAKARDDSLAAAGGAEEQDD